jgi:hypothetical protein
MCENLFDPADIRKFTETKVSTIHRSLALRALDEASLVDIQEIGLTMAGERAVTGFVFLTGGLSGRSPSPSLWSKVIAEVYEFFCTKSKAYTKERTQGVGLFEHAVTVITTALAASINVGTGLLTGLVTVALIALSKVGRNAWCKWASEAILPSASATQ